MRSKRFLLIVGIFVVLLIIFALQSCNRDEIQPPQMITGGNLETGTTLPTGWYYDSGQNTYTGNWTEEEAASPKRSLKIYTPTPSYTLYGFWGHTVSTNIPIGKDVTLSVKIKGHLTGKGVSIAIRGDNSLTLQGAAEQFVTTEGDATITGTFDWKEQTIKMKQVGSNITSLSVFLIYQPNTIGEVYFDNISLTY